MSATNNTNTSNDKNVGILAIEIYTPKTYITQPNLEKHNNVSSGKYTIGLGQDAIGIINGDAEDVNSISLTVVQSLLEKYDIDPNDIGRLEIGTETLVDKSKSTKTVLMSLFPDNNRDIEGVTVINACYGGTAALLNTFAWVESDGWDGRYGIVVAADIAAYAKGAARPTSGAGAVALLIGRDAPLAFCNPKERVTHAAHVWDFFKPDHNVEYPTVNGSLSQVCYYQALEDCYLRFVDKMEKIDQDASDGKDNDGLSTFDAESADYFVFHAPYNKLVQKSYARLFLLDARRKYEHEKNQSQGEDADTDANTDHPLKEWLTKPIEETYTDKLLEKELKKLSSTSFEKRLSDANSASKLIGNTYAASVFMGIASLIDKIGGGDDENHKSSIGKKVVVFSYGSGSMASMYRLHIRTPTNTTATKRFSIDKMSQVINFKQRLSSRIELDAKELDEVMDCREKMHKECDIPYVPTYTYNSNEEELRKRLFPGTYYLKRIDENWTRHYCRLP
jgi:hydroxymethylglutaryl-CoA synthase